MNVTQTTVDWHNLLYKFAAKWKEYRPVETVEFVRDSIHLYRADRELSALLDTYFNNTVPAIIVKYPQLLFFEGRMYEVYARPDRISIKLEMSSTPLHERGSMLDHKCMDLLQQMDETLQLEGLATFMNNRCKERVFWSPDLGLIQRPMLTTPVFAHSKNFTEILEEQLEEARLAYSPIWDKFKTKYEISNGSNNPRFLKILVPSDTPIHLVLKAHLQFCNGEPVLRFALE